MIDENLDIDGFLDWLWLGYEYIKKRSNDNYDFRDCELFIKYDSFISVHPFLTRLEAHFDIEENAKTFDYECERLYKIMFLDPLELQLKNDTKAIQLLTIKKIITKNERFKFKYLDAISNLEFIYDLDKWKNCSLLINDVIRLKFIIFLKKALSNKDPIEYISNNSSFDYRRRHKPIKWNTQRNSLGTIIGLLIRGGIIDPTITNASNFVANNFIDMNSKRMNAKSQLQAMGDSRMNSDTGTPLYDKQINIDDLITYLKSKIK